jgi:GTP-binding protein LepA
VLRALIFDSEYDRFRGLVAFIRIVDGRVATGDRIRFCATGREFDVLEVGLLQLRRVPQFGLGTGEVGYLIAGVKDVHDVRVGDTITAAGHPDVDPLPGYRPMKPMVFSGLYPIDPEEFVPLREALMKLTLNDASLIFEPESSAALGSGFRCGFLGPLHNEIVLERLRREYDVDLISTVPNVGYRVVWADDGRSIEVHNPSAMPPIDRRMTIEEPLVSTHIIMPPDAIGQVTELCEERRGIHQGLEYLESSRVLLKYQIPLAEIITDFYDRLKSASRGYASLDYELAGYRAADLVRCDVLLNGDPVDAFCAIIHRDRAFAWGREMTERLKALIPKQLFQISVQVALGPRVIARSTIPALRKNVTAKCYGGDITRKRKLLERQKEGKKRMKLVGKVHVPQEAFLAILRKQG